MKSKIYCLFLTLAFLVSCQDEEAQRQATLKDAKKKDLIFDSINKGWTFSVPTLNPKTQSMVSNWAELRLFLLELNQKPQSSIGAFQKKSKVLSAKAKDLSASIPPPFNKPEIKSRIAVLMTKINSINLFINLDEIPAEKVISLIKDTNEEMRGFYRQMDEIVRKSEIPKEQGEADMIRMLDTSRAIPNTPKPQTLQPDLNLRPHTIPPKR